jgi:hypothetical protein
MIRTARSYPPFAVAGFACVAGLSLLAWSVVGAVHAPPVAPQMGGVAVGRVNLPVAAARPLPGPGRAAVDADPFRTDRRRPPKRFTVPGTGAAPIVAAPAPALVLSGTVVYQDGGGLALLRVQGRSAMVRVGETVGGLTLKSVAREVAVFARPGGGQLVLHVPKAGS